MFWSFEFALKWWRIWSCYRVELTARPAKAIREMRNKALSWPPLPSLLFFSIFSPSRPHVLALSLSAVRVCVWGELWGKGRASEREQLSFAVSQCISNAPRSVSLCVSSERRVEGEGRRVNARREGKIHAAARKCGFPCRDAVQFSVLCRWQCFSMCVYERVWGCCTCAFCQGGGHVWRG